MTNDFTVTFEGRPPTLDALQVLVEDYLGEAFSSVIHGQAYLAVGLRGNGSSPLKRLGGSDIPRGPRFLEVHVSHKSIRVHTRAQDDYTNTLAFGLSRLIARFWDGRYNAHEDIPFDTSPAKRRTRVSGADYVCHIPAAWGKRSSGAKTLCGRLLCDVNSWASKKDFKSFDADLEANCRACLKAHRAAKAR